MIYIYIINNLQTLEHHIIEHHIILWHYDAPGHYDALIFHENS
jgi:hypothetical protein